jgi:hypothetical protein
MTLQIRYNSINILFYLRYLIPILVKINFDVVKGVPGLTASGELYLLAQIDTQEIPSLIHMTATGLYDFPEDFASSSKV